MQLKGTAVVLMLLVSTGLGCTSVLIPNEESNSVMHYYTGGVAEISQCKGTLMEETNLETGKTVKVCYGESLNLKSEGFTGWDVIDAALTGFLSWITFGAITL